jgi:hypothetical protein
VCFREYGDRLPLGENCSTNVLFVVRLSQGVSDINTLNLVTTAVVLKAACFFGELLKISDFRKLSGKGNMAALHRLEKSPFPDD